MQHSSEDDIVGRHGQIRILQDDSRCVAPELEQGGFDVLSSQCPDGRSHTDRPGKVDELDIRMSYQLFRPFGFRTGGELDHLQDFFWDTGVVHDFTEFVMQRRDLLVGLPDDGVTAC